MERPIIIIGSGRSGSTAFSRVLSSHKDLVYMSQLTSKLPGLMFLSKFYLMLTKIPLVGYHVGKIFKLAEAYSLWNRMAENFSRPKKNIGSDDILEGDDVKIRNTLEKLSLKSNSRLIIKLTGWPRIGYLLKVFPDAVFINIIRDGRAVAYSLMNSDFWWGRKGPQGWRLGDLPEEQKALYERHDKSITALAGIYWNILMNAVEMDTKKYVPNVITIKYEDFCEEQKKTIRDVCDFCGLEWYGTFEKTVDKNKMNNMNYKWKSELLKKDADILNEVTLQWREKLDYN